MTVLNNCDSTSGWGTNVATTIATDSVTYNSSPSSLKLTNTQAECNAYVTFTSIDMTNLDYISFYVYVADYSNITYMSMDMYSGDWAGSYTYEIPSSNYASNGWKHITVYKASFNTGWGTPNWNSITGFNFYTYNSDTNTINANIDTVEYFLASVNITPTVMTSSSDIVVPAVSVGSNIDSVVMESTSDMVTPSIGIGVNITPSTMESTSECLIPSITTDSVDIDIQAIVMESTSNMVVPTLNMDLWINPVINWSGNNYLNPEDLNRVESNTQYLLNLALNYFVNPNLVGVKTNWSNSDYIYHTVMNKIESNIKLLSDCTYIPLDWITPVTNWITSDTLDYTDFNRIEGNLLSLYIMYHRIIAEFEYCGQIYCGQTFAL